MRAAVVGIIFSVCLISQATHAQETEIVRLDNHANALIYIPKSLGENPPMLMALHGMRESPLSAIKTWYRIAEKYGYVLIAPEGGDYKDAFLRAPIDDRKNFIAFKELLKKRYNINEKASILAGFSRGGSYAIETGLLYPDHFPNILSIFGFFNIGVEQLILPNPKQTYANSKFYLISGEKAYSLKSNNKGIKILNDIKIPSQLFLYKHEVHRYPSDLERRFLVIRKWMGI
jgi:hypothetical protein